MVGYELTQVLFVPVQSPVHSYEYVPLPPETVGVNVIFWLMTAGSGAAEQVTFNGGAGLTVTEQSALAVSSPEVTVKDAV